MDADDQINRFPNDQANQSTSSSCGVAEQKLFELEDSRLKHALLKMIERDLEKEFKQNWFSLEFKN